MAESTREQLLKLQSLMKEQQTTAVVELQDILKRPEFAQAITDIKAIRESFIPGSAEESQLDAVVSVYESVKSYFETMYPTFNPGGTPVDPVAPTP